MSNREPETPEEIRREIEVLRQLAREQRDYAYKQGALGNHYFETSGEFAAEGNEERADALSRRLAAMESAGG